MTTPFQPAPAAAVVYGPDGTPYYAAPAPLTNPPALYQAHTPVPVPAQPLNSAAVYLPAPPAQQHADAAGRDPWPARLLAGGIGIGGAGLGLGFLLQALAAATTGLALLVAALGTLYLLKNSSGSGGRGGPGAVNVSVNVTNRNR
ncbi:hypothetical protein ACFWIQ_10965 [Kitasatospora sp. NPDC127059]|uniref:hypothetical protein n=1 Tax=unclassified Kitasatospora TaxID=2633591 RepID=UPI00365DD6F2